MNVIALLIAGIGIPSWIMFLNMYFFQNDLYKLFRTSLDNTIILYCDRDELETIASKVRGSALSDLFLSFASLAVSVGCIAFAFSNGASFSYLAAVPGFIFGSVVAASSRTVFLNNLEPFCQVALAIKNLNPKL